MFRGVNPPGVTLIRCRLHVTFSSKLSSLDHPSTSPASSSASAKSITRGVVGGGLLSTCETSRRGVVGAESSHRGVVGAESHDGVGGVALDFMGVLVLVLADFRGERRMVGIVKQVFGGGDC
jgi:hypothetical protein